MAEISQQNAEDQISSKRLKAIFGGSIGNLVEWYDWYAYSAFAIYFSASFFPKGNTTVQLLNTAAPDVLIVDLGLPDGSGITLVQAAHTTWPDCNIMVSSAFADESHVMRSLEAGATGYLLKDCSQRNLLNEIRSIHAGGSPISPLIARKILMRFENHNKTAKSTSPVTESCVTLSAREQEVLELITKGFTAAEIAALLAVSHHTVLTFIRRIYAKLKVNSKTEAIYEARIRGLLNQ